jgi:hydrogenase expression/formation protein HypC
VCLAIPGQVVEVLDEANQLAEVDVAGVRRTVNVSLLGEGTGAQPGEWVLIHVGFALSRIDEREAHATLQLLREAQGGLEEAIDELRASAIE